MGPVHDVAQRLGEERPQALLPIVDATESLDDVSRRQPIPQLECVLDEVLPDAPRREFGCR
jgi:hypothetical protein